MSRIDELKKQYPHYNITLLDIFRKLDPTKSGKYMSIFSIMMDEMYKKRLSDRHQAVYLTERLQDRNIDSKGMSQLEMTTFIYFLDLIPTRDYEVIVEFADFMERGLIEKNDILTYKTMDEIRAAVSSASLKTYSKELESQVHKEFEDNTWIAVRPLSFEASAKYGSATKWCTTYRYEKEYFAKYFSKGVLVYFINKITGYKFALFSEVYEGDNDISFWNAEDNRVDFLQLEIDGYLLPIIRNLATCKIKNKDFLTEEKLYQLYSSCNYMSGEKLSQEEDVPQVVENYRALIPPPVNDVVIRMNGNGVYTQDTLTQEEPQVEEQSFVDRVGNRLRALITPTYPTITPVTNIEEDCRG